MSEHWKSTPKYWCKHCSIYVKDTPFERKQHENTGKHQGNLKRFLQGIQKDHAKSEREKEKTAAEVERLNRLAGVPNSSSKSPTPTPASTKQSKSTPTTLSAADQKRQWAQLAEMGISIPEHARAEMAMAGDWQVTARKIDPGTILDNNFDDNLNVGIRKRKFEDDEEREEAGETVVRKGWGSTTKVYPNTKQPADDLGALLASSLSRKPAEATKSGSASNDNVLDPGTKDSESRNTIKLEYSSSEQEERSNAQMSDEKASSPSSTSPNIKAEVIRENSEIDSTIEPLPVFKRRKAKQPSTTKIAQGKPA